MLQVFKIKLIGTVCQPLSLSLAVIVMDMLHIISSFREMIAMREGNVILQDKLKDVIIDLGFMTSIIHWSLMPLMHLFLRESYE